MAITVVPGATWAQEEGRVGLTMGYPSAIGLLWQPANRVALRPEFTVSKGASESSSSDPILGSSASITPSDNWQAGVGLSALLYVNVHNGVTEEVT